MTDAYTDPDIEQYLEHLRREYEFGQHAEGFWSSPLGKYVIGCSLQESEKATAELKNVDPEDPQKVRELQNKIQIAERACQWIGEAIEAGRAAGQQFEIEEDLREEPND